VLGAGENPRINHDNVRRGRGATPSKASSVSEGAGELTDQALMLRYQRGDRAAFVSLVQRHQKPLFNFVLRRIGSPVAAEDITQEAFIKVVQSATTFKHEARFSTWLYSIARNLCIDQSRRGKIRDHRSLDATGRDERTLGDRVADMSRLGDVDRAVASTEVQDSILKALEGLPDEQREVFLLREIANLPFKEVAVVVGTNENTVKSRMRYALERLREALSDFEEYARALR
jgi:RNA polymerase sigma-70 factor (ECF subfamily)